MSTVIKSVRIDEDTLLILERVNKILNKVFHSDMKLNFSKTVNNAIIARFESDSEYLLHLINEKGFYNRDKAGNLVFTPIDDSLFQEMKEVADLAAGKFYSHMMDDEV